MPTMPTRKATSLINNFDIHWSYYTYNNIIVSLQLQATPLISLHACFVTLVASYLPTEPASLQDIAGQKAYTQHLRHSFTTSHYPLSSNIVTFTNHHVHI